MYIKITNGIPENYSIGKLRRDNPNVSFPKSISNEILAKYDIYPLTTPEKPTVDPRTQAAEPGDFVNVEGSWTKPWVIRQKDAEEIQAYDDNMIAKVKKEAQVRVLAVLPEWKQRNLTARAAELAAKGQANWTPEEQAEWEAGQAMWDKIKAIRAASDILEATVPIPEDYRDDKYWS